MDSEDTPIERTVVSPENSADATKGDDGSEGREAAPAGPAAPSAGARAPAAAAASDVAVAPAAVAVAPAVASRIFPDAVTEAGQLMRHAARSGKPLTDEAIKTIVEVERALPSQIDVELECKFWRIFTDLTKSMQPATVEGITETRPFYPPPMSLKTRFIRWWSAVFDGAQPSQIPPAAHRESRLFRNWALIVLLLIMISQPVAFLMGQSITYLDALNAKLVEIEKSGQALSSGISEKTSVQRMQEASLSQLRLYCKMATLDFVDCDNINTSALPYFCAQLVYVINHYLLPLLIGTLGAITAILRRVSEQIREDSFSTEGTILFRVQFVLGPVAGAAVGFALTSPESTAVVFNAILNGPTAPDETGSKLGEILRQEFLLYALPFLAGYSSEFFFAILDRMIAGIRLSKS
jgi:hypothetical protein